MLLNACALVRPRALPETSPQVSSSEVNAFLKDMLGSASSMTYEDLVARLGSPLRVDTAFVDEPERRAPDTMRTLVYPGLELGLHERTGSRDIRLTHFMLTDPRYTSPEGLRVGYSESQVLGMLGVPTRRETTELIYKKTHPSNCLLVVFLEQRTVSRMVWQFPE